MALGIGACESGREAPAGAPAVPPAAGTVTADDGVPIAYEVRGAGEPTLVFIHGWCCNREFWRNQLDVFGKDHRVVALDLPGHGASGARRAQWSIAGYGADVRSVVETLGLSKVVLVGHSLGGPVALEAARRLPGRVVAVIAVDTLQDAEFEMPADAVEGMAARFEKDFTGTMSQAVRSMFPDTADPVVVEWTLNAALATDHAAAAAIIRDYPNFRMRDALAAAGVPIRCLNSEPRGEEGLPTAVEKNRRYADFDAVILPDVGHFPMLEKPDEFNAALRKALDGVAGS
jgi:pimeloyl-ACP methyl ester carboxylesterase